MLPTHFLKLITQTVCWNSFPSELSQKSSTPNSTDSWHASPDQWSTSPCVKNKKEGRKENVTTYSKIQGRPGSHPHFRLTMLRGGRGLLQHGFVEVAEGPAQILKIDLWVGEFEVMVGVIQGRGALSTFSAWSPCSHCSTIHRSWALQIEERLDPCPKWGTNTTLSWSPSSPACLHPLPTLQRISICSYFDVVSCAFPTLYPCTYFSYTFFAPLLLIPFFPNLSQISVLILSLSASLFCSPLHYQLIYLLYHRYSIHNFELKDIWLYLTTQSPINPFTQPPTHPSIHLPLWPLPPLLPTWL